MIPKPRFRADRIQKMVSPLKRLSLKKAIYAKNYLNDLAMRPSSKNVSAPRKRSKKMASPNAVKDAIKTQVQQVLESLGSSAPDAVIEQALLALLPGAKVVVRPIKEKKILDALRGAAKAKGKTTVSPLQRQTDKPEALAERGPA